MSFLKGISDSVHHAMRNPFGLEFKVNGSEIHVPLGSVINCIGYNDHLERLVGVARIAFALYSLATSQKKEDRLCAAGHVFRGFLEMHGDFELYLLIVDAAFTIYNIATKVFGINPEQAMKDAGNVAQGAQKLAKLAATTNG